MARMGPIDVGFALVHCSSLPTPKDSIGCDGLYIERVEFKPWYRWPVKSAVWIAWRFVVHGTRINIKLGEWKGAK